MQSPLAPSALAQVPYREIERARRRLPRACTTGPRRAFAEVHAEDGAKVLVTFELLCITEAGHPHWMWGLHSAVSGPGAGGEQRPAPRPTVRSDPAA